MEADHAKLLRNMDYASFLIVLSHVNSLHGVLGVLAQLLVVLASKLAIVISLITMICLKNVLPEFKPNPVNPHHVVLWTAVSTTLIGALAVVKVTDEEM
jgi:hypothetical protein